MPSCEARDGVPNPSDVIKILLATDNHLGYGEKHPHKFDDSFITFDEILEIGLEHGVDMVLLGGDLFHENKPSRQAQNKCLEILRKRVLGDLPVHIEVVSDQKINFGHVIGRHAVNYTDPNMNIALPIFTIHGNHDDPCGLGGHSVIDSFHAAGLLNYFGKVTNLKEIQVSPILITKGQAKLALYGISSVKDERLYRLFRENKVSMCRPEECTDEWFNLLVLHQNRAKHGPTNYIPANFIDGFFDLVLWGHEHECRLTPEKVVYGDDKTFHITQPGSSVATSLCEGEAVPKKVGILEVNERRFKMTEIPLKTVRPTIFKTVTLDENEEDLDLASGSEKRVQANIEAFLKRFVEGVLRRDVPPLLTGHPKQPQLPQIRVRVEYSEESHQLTPGRFGNHFADRVANPSELLLFRKKVEKRIKDDESGFDEARMEHVMRLSSIASAGKSMEYYISEYFKESDKKGDRKNQMKLLGIKGISAAIQRFIEKDDKDAIELIVEKQLEKTLRRLDNEDIDDEMVDDLLDEFKQEREGGQAANGRGEAEEVAETLKALDDVNRVSRRSEEQDDDDDDDDIDSMMADLGKVKPTRGGRGRSTMTTTGTRYGKDRETKTVVPNSDESPNEDNDFTPSRRGRRGSAGSRGKSSPVTKGRGGRGRGRGKKCVVSPPRTQTDIFSAFKRQSQVNTSRLSSRPSGRSVRNVVYDSDTESD